MSEPGRSHRSLRATHDRFAKLIEADATEPEFQRLFSDNPFIFSRTLRLRHEPTEVIPLGRPGKSEPDFVLFPEGENPLGLFGVVEIKRPSSLIVVERRKDILSLSSDVNTALDQVKAYSHQAALQPIVHKGHVVLLGSRGHLFIIAGLSDDLARRVTNELARGDELLPPNSELIPYDTLLDLFRQTIPPQIHVVVPDESPAVEPDSPVEFVTLDQDYSRLEELSFGSAAWESDIASVFRTLIRGRGVPSTVRIAQKADSQELVGAGAFVLPGPDIVSALDLHDALPRSSAYIAAVGIRRDFRRLTTPNGQRISDRLMGDIFDQICQKASDGMPAVWCLIAKENVAAQRVAARNDFRSHRVEGSYDLWVRPLGATTHQ